MQYYRLRGDCYSKIGHYDEAVEDFRKVVESNPLLKDDRITLSRTLFKAGKYIEATDGENTTLQQKQISKNNKKKFLRTIFHLTMSKPYRESKICESKLYRQPTNAFS